MSEQDRDHGVSGPLDVLVIGCLGMLGCDLTLRLETAGMKTAGLDLPDIDITDEKGVETALEKLEPAVVINCAAYTAVDKAEEDAEAAFAVNRDGPRNLAVACRDRGSVLVHISTDYIFDGGSRRAYREDDPPGPLGVYARSKWEGEEAVRKGLEQHLIIRTAWLYGLHGPNFVKTMIRLAREREVIRVVADQWGCPTWSEDLAGAITRIVERVRTAAGTVPWGTYHYCGGGRTNWYEFAQAIIDQARRWEGLAVREVAPITTDQYPTPARRPMNSVLDCRKIERHFGVKPQPWRLSTQRFVAKLLGGSGGGAVTP